MTDTGNEYEHQWYVDLVVDGDGTPEFPGCPPLSEAPTEATTAIRALAAHPETGAPAQFSSPRAPARVGPGFPVWRVS